MKKHRSAIAMLSWGAAAIAAVSGLTMATAHSSAHPKVTQVTERYTIRIPEDVYTFTHRGQFTRTVPDDVKRFTDSINHDAIAFLTNVRDDTGEVVGYAVQLEGPPVRPAMNGSGPLLPTQWVIVRPGRGTIFLHQVKDSSQVTDTIKLSAGSNGSWVGDLRIKTTRGPAPNGEGIVVGGTGEFENITGEFNEVNHWKEFDKNKPMGAYGQLEITVTRSPGKPKKAP